MPNDKLTDLPEALQGLVSDYHQTKAPAYFTERVMANARATGDRKTFWRPAWIGAAVVAIIVAVVAVPLLQPTVTDVQLAQTDTQTQVSNVPDNQDNLPAASGALEYPDMTEPIAQAQVLVMADAWLASLNEDDLPGLADIDAIPSLSDIPDPFG
ncbi:MAG: hypothetical protein BMS9Abin06_0983 [Gammaproteobacteria bacterium]|nr:MAG: hypothetical protein BMS9Abin06_0983 [Gammaproteobacteria bacterium]